MGLIIAASAGLAVGVSLFIFALRERGKRHSAEAAHDKMKCLLTVSQSTVSRLNTEVNVVRRDRDLCRAQINVLRSTIAGLHTKLAECKDPEAVEKLLNDELGEQL